MFEKRFRILQKKMPVSCITYLNSFNLLIEYDKICTESHVGKYDRADDRPKLAMLAANVGYQYWTDDRSRLGW